MPKPVSDQRISFHLFFVLSQFKCESRFCEVNSDCVGLDVGCVECVCEHLVIEKVCTCLSCLQFIAYICFLSSRCLKQKRKFAAMGAEKEKNTLELHSRTCERHRSDTLPQIRFRLCDYLSFKYAMRFQNHFSQFDLK